MGVEVSEATRMTSAPPPVAAEAPAHFPYRHERFWNLPNTVTMLRIGVVPILLFIPYARSEFASTFMAWVFIVAASSDLLDGWLARRGGEVTRIGKLLDPLADKLLAMTALVLLVAMPERIPLWSVPLVILILARELAVTALRAMASAEGVVVAASNLGKWKTGFQIAAITALLIHHSWFGVPVHALGIGLLVVATGFTVWSGIDYFAAYLGGRTKEKA